MQTTGGTVTALWRYPVKSMGGVPVSEAVLGAQGIVGDRAYAVRERATGHVASAKHARKWGALLHCRAAYRAPPQPGAALPPLWITLPDGTGIAGDDPAVHERLSELLGRAVELIHDVPETPTREANRAPVDAEPGAELIREEEMALAAPGTFFDHAPLHLLTTATLQRLQALYPGGRFDPRRFRPNLLIECAEGSAGFAENEWIGRELRVGDAQLAVLDPTPRCVITTLPQPGLPHDPGILRTVHRHNSATSATVAPGAVLPTIAGVYAVVGRGGQIRVGAAVRVGASPLSQT